MSAADLTVSVIICCYTEERLSGVERATPLANKVK